MVSLRVVAATLITSTLAPFACASFEEREAAPELDAGVDSPTSTGDGADAATDAAPDAAAPAKTLYVFGGVSGGAAGLESFEAPIAADGSLGAWKRSPLLDVARFAFAGAVSPEGMIVVAGGHATETAFLATTEVASLDPITAWAGAPPLTAAAVAGSGAYVAGRFYVIGGFDGTNTFVDTIVSSSSAGATLAPWKPAGTLPARRAGHAAIAFGSRVYVTGGAVVDASGIVTTAETLMGAVATDGSLGGWIATGSLPAPTIAVRVVADGLRLFAVGGENADGIPTAAVAVGTPAEDQTIEWTPTAPMPGPLSTACVVAANGVLYVIGGVAVKNGPETASVYVGRIGADGAIAWAPSGALPVGRAGHGCAIR